MTRTHHSILSAAFSPAARIGGGGSAPTTHAPAVTSFADGRASVAPTVSGCITAGLARGPMFCPYPTAGGLGSRRFFEFGAVAGSSCQRADAINVARCRDFLLSIGFVLVNPRTPGADGANRVNAGGIQ